MTLQVKETGVPVDFTNAREIALQMYTFQNDIFGISAYQSTPVTVDATTRNNFANGNLADLQNQANGQGMPIQYIRISWNETQQGSNYYITDLVVGVVSRVTRDFNTGPAYLLDALKALGWFNQLISKVSMPWKAWLLLNPPQQITSFMTWDWEAVSGTWAKTAPIGQPIPDPPSIDELKTVFINEGKVDQAMGEFVRKMVEGGYATTILPNGYRVQICYQRSPEIRQPGGYTHGYQYRTHTRLSVDFTTDPEITELGKIRSLIGWIAFCVGVAIIVIISGLAAGAILWFNNISTTSKTTTKYGIVGYNPDGTPIIGVTETSTETGPPEWWGSVLTIVGVVGVIVVAAIVIPRVLPKKKEKD